MSAEKGWIGEPQAAKEWTTPGWLAEKGTGHSHFHNPVDTDSGSGKVTSQQTDHPKEDEQHG